MTAQAKVSTGLSVFSITETVFSSYLEPFLSVTSPLRHDSAHIFDVVESNDFVRGYQYE